MKKNTIYSGIVAVALALGACSKDDNTTAATFNSDDMNFMTMAANGGYAEIQLGQLAAAKGSDPDVKSFGQMMVTDHTMANSSLDSVAKTGNVMLTPTLDSMHMALQQQLNSLSGRAFDSAYMKSQVMDHVKTDSLFGAEQTKTTADARLKGFVNRFRPNIQMHLQMAQAISSRF